MTAALPLRVVEGASKFIEGASLYKTFTIGPSPVRKQASLASLEEMHSPLWWLVPPPCPVGSMSLDSRVAYSSPMNPVPLPPPQAGALWVLSHGAMSLQESIETYSAS